jgi:hypothetical protein
MITYHRVDHQEEPRVIETAREWHQDQHEQEIEHIQR